MIDLPRPLLGRDSELAALRKCYQAGMQGQLVMMYGRRRIGKSYLLEAFGKTVPTIFYQASYESEAKQLAAFTQLVFAHEGEALTFPRDYVFSSWESAFEYLARQPREARLVVVLDEFPYLVAETPALPSILQRFWDRGGNRSSLMIVLCGSAQAFMTSLESAAAPLHQRFTAKLHIAPLSYRDAALFTPHLGPSERACVYGVLGGTPLYLAQWNERISFRDNLLELFADPASMLVDSAELVLTTDLADSRAALRILQAVGDGNRRASEIRDSAQVTHERILPRLTELSLLERRVPATEDPLRSKRSTYHILDPYFRFYFRFIAKNRGAIDRLLGADVVDRQIIPYFDDYMGPIFEDMARDFTWDLLRAGILQGDAVGSWSSRDGSQEIDIVGTQNVKRVTFAGSVKWRKQLLDGSVLKNLEAHAASFASEQMQYVLIGRGGVKKSLMGTRVSGYSLADMYRAV